VTYSILYKGPLLSSNKFYAGIHWRQRTKLKEDYALIFNSLLVKAKVKKFEEFSLIMKFNSRHDVDNVTATAKIFIDTLKGKYVDDDTKEYFKSLSIIYDPTLEKNSALFEINTNGNH